ncbi:GTPase IMAP family member 9-like [Oncorhynchus clarkii lewisi]|uniref:GTPase IMAP family member 9-like n=1 Tax=Oncorhynchus clarkii lewisi TaxID=490388 RepID=UPI0039B8A08C
MSELEIILFGEQSTGNISAGNIILGKQIFNATTNTESHKQRKGVVICRLVTVVDTPGWDPLSTEDATLTTSNSILNVACRSVGWNSPKAGSLALLLVVQVCLDPEWNQCASRRLERLFSERIWRQTILLFTRADLLSCQRSIEDYLQGAGEAFQGLLEKCENRYHDFNNKLVEEDSTQVAELLQKIENMMAQNNGDIFNVRVA